MALGAFGFTVNAAAVARWSRKTSDALVPAGPLQERFGPFDGLYFNSRAELDAYVRARKGRLLAGEVGPGKLPRNAPEFGGFAQGIMPEEISSINRNLGGVVNLTGDVSTSLANAARREGFWNKSATLVRDIAGRHMFNDANKRTAQAVVEELMRRNAVTSGITSDQMRKVIQRVATGELREIDDIARALRGF
ncbi:MAG: hypothetical protein KatS3mg105_4667 [Gemmatales bacterium]|nr:MAG: hypothetical protein KatS3mg105_4667 [Gemmatales bacterium]